MILAYGNVLSWFQYSLSPSTCLKVVSLPIHTSHLFACSDERIEPRRIDGVL